jgi:protein-tyrosine phosphatase
MKTDPPRTASGSSFQTDGLRELPPPEAGPVLAGAPNFRDLGGCAGAGGRVVRPGRVFRSQVLAAATDGDLETLGRLGIGAVLDLRGEREARRRNRWPSGPPPRTVRIDVGDLDAAPATWGRRLLDPSFDEICARATMAEVYRRMPHAYAPHLAGLFGLLAAPTCPPVLIHCEAGKDRTGFVCAILLRSLGVSLERVLADYTLSRRYYRLDPRALLGRHYGDELPARALGALRVMEDVHPDLLAAALDGIDAEYGSVEGYLEAAAGVDAARLDGVRASLLGP